MRSPCASRESATATLAAKCQRLPVPCSSLITKVRRAKTAAEERAIIKKEAAYIRTALSQNLNKYTKRNMIKLMYMRMLGYPVEFGQVPCLALITKGDYSEKVRGRARTLQS